jgi:charged multivesicular body protein 1
MNVTELQNLQFNLKFSGKQFAKSSKKCEKEEKQEMMKCKKAMEKSNMEGAKIYAENAIRKKNDALNFLRLSARMDAVASRLDTAIKMKMVTKSMGSMVNGMDKVLQGMNPDQIARLMDKFETQFETMDVTAEYMQSSLGQSAATSTPDDQVTTLMQQVADEHGLDVRQQMSTQMGGGTLPAAPQRATADPEMDELSARVAALNAK